LARLNCFACMLGGPDRRTLFMVTAPTSKANGLAARLEGRIEIVQVEVPGAGRP
jgi:sugar lactone lactonase YvrE